MPNKIFINAEIRKTDFLNTGHLIEKVDTVTDWTSDNRLAGFAETDHRFHRPSVGAQDFSNTIFQIFSGIGAERN